METVCSLRLQEMVMLRANLAGPKLEISHFEESSCLNRRVSSGEDAADMKSSTWTAKIIVPVSERLM
jgi:hypothetical protein